MFLLKTQKESLEICCHENIFISLFSSTSSALFPSTLFQHDFVTKILLKEFFLIFYIVILG